MATVTYADADVLIDNNRRIGYVFSGEAVAPGQIVFRSTGDDLWYLADSNNLATAPQSLDGDLYGVALNLNYASGQPLAVAKSGSLVYYGTGVFTANDTLFVSQVTGAMDPDPIGATEYSIKVGVAIDSANLSVTFQASGVPA